MARDKTNFTAKIFKDIFDVDGIGVKISQGNIGKWEFEFEYFMAGESQTEYSDFGFDSPEEACQKAADALHYIINKKEQELYDVPF